MTNKFNLRKSLNYAFLKTKLLRYSYCLPPSFIDTLLLWVLSLALNNDLLKSSKIVKIRF